MSNCKTTDLKINLGHGDLYFMVQWFCFFFFFFFALKNILVLLAWRESAELRYPVTAHILNVHSTVSSNFKYLEYFEQTKWDFLALEWHLLVEQNMDLQILAINRGYSIFCHEYDFYFIKWSETIYISWVVSGSKRATQKLILTLSCFNTKVLLIIFSINKTLFDSTCNVTSDVILARWRYVTV